MVEAVEPGSPADSAGIQVGDVITQLDGKAIADGATLQSTIRSEKAGKAVTVIVLRGGQSTTLHATLGTTQIALIARCTSRTTAAQVSTDRAAVVMRPAVRQDVVVFGSVVSVGATSIAGHVAPTMPTR